MTKFIIDAYQHHVSYMWIYTAHYYSNSFNCSIWLPHHNLHTDIWPQSRVFSLLQSWHVLHRPTHHVTVYIMSIRSLEVYSFIYFEFLMGTYCSYVRTLWEPFQALEGDPYHNVECQESKWVLISIFIELQQNASNLPYVFTDYKVS
jgi:hypothetical protein